MYIDMIRYKLAQGIDEAALKNAADDITEIWMKKQDGFLGWDIHQTSEGYIDFVYWKDKASADQATQNMKDIPQDHAWMKCYDMTTVSAEKAQQILSYK